MTERDQATHQGNLDNEPVGASDSSRPASRTPRELKGPNLIPGAVVGGGRYRLLAPQGGSRGLHFWHGRDVELDREVALIFVDPDRRDPEWAKQVFRHTMPLARFDRPGQARVLDVVRSLSGGIIVAEWTAGSPLAEVATTHPPARGAAMCVAALAEAASEAHNSGSVLCIDHPDRIRVSTEGEAVLAFPATLPDATAEDDIRGLGAAFHHLVASVWPLASTTGPGPVPRPTEELAPLRDIAPETPWELATLSDRCLAGDGVRSAGSVAELLDQAAVAEEQTELISLARDAKDRREASADHGASTGTAGTTGAAASAGGPGGRPRPAAGHGSGPAYFQDSSDDRSRRIILSAVAVLSVIVITIAVFGLARLFGFSSSTEPVSVKDLHPDHETAQPAPDVGGEDGTGELRDAQVKAVALAPSDNVGDDADGITAITDGDPGTTWSTDTYQAQIGSGPGALKPGLGPVLEVAGEGTPGKVVLSGISQGTKVEIRSIPTVDTEVSTGRVLGSATAESDTLTIDLSNAPSLGDSRYLVVWLTALGDSPSYTSSIGDVTVQVR